MLAKTWTFKELCETAKDNALFWAKYTDPEINKENASEEFDKQNTRFFECGLAVLPEELNDDNTVTYEE